MHRLVPRDPNIRDQIIEITKKIREIWGLTYDDGGLRLSDLVEVAVGTAQDSGLNYLVSFENRKRFTNSLVGYVLFRDSVIILNASVRPERLPFVLAHEIGHIWLNHTGLSRILDPAKRKRQKEEMEIEANFFAYNLVMPTDIFIAKAVSENFRFSRLKQTLNVSRGQCIRRYVMLKAGAFHFQIRDGHFHYIHSHPHGIIKCYDDGGDAGKFLQSYDLTSEFSGFKKQLVSLHGVDYSMRIFNSSNEFNEWTIECVGVRASGGWEIMSESQEIRQLHDLIDKYDGLSPVELDIEAEGAISEFLSIIQFDGDPEKLSSEERINAAVGVIHRKIYKNICEKYDYCDNKEDIKFKHTVAATVLDVVVSVATGIPLVSSFCAYLIHRHLDSICDCD